MQSDRPRPHFKRTSRYPQHSRESRHHDRRHDLLLKSPSRASCPVPKRRFAQHSCPKRPGQSKCSRRKPFSQQEIESPRTILPRRAEDQATPSSVARSVAVVNCRPSNRPWGSRLRCGVWPTTRRDSHGTVASRSCDRGPTTQLPFPGGIPISAQPVFGRLPPPFSTALNSLQTDRRTWGLVGPLDIESLFWNILRIRPLQIPLRSLPELRLGAAGLGSPSPATPSTLAQQARQGDGDSALAVLPGG